MATAPKTPQWHPSYWNADQHGTGWAKVREAFKRDWAQTKADVHISSGKELNQNVGDTVKQAAGREPIPAPNQPNFEAVEQAVEYGFAAHEQYGRDYQQWDTKLEDRLAREWNERETGMTFEAAKPHVRMGWENRR